MGLKISLNDLKKEIGLKMTHNATKMIWPTVNQIADIDPLTKKNRKPSKAVLGSLPYYTRGIVKF